MIQDGKQIISELFYTGILKDFKSGFFREFKIDIVYKVLFGCYHYMEFELRDSHIIIDK